MIRVQKCVTCGKSFEFDPDDCQANLLQDFGSRITYVAECPYCGSQNQVEAPER